MSANVTKQTAVSKRVGLGDLYARSNLTRMQLLYWTGYQLRPDVPLYAAPLIFAFTGEFDTNLFCNALQIVMDQSDALRTVIQMVDGVPQQKVQPHVEAL